MSRPEPTQAPLHVLVAGGGVAAVELVLALRDLAGDRVRLTMVAPERDFELRALRTAEPFAADHVRRHSLRELAERVDATLVAGTVAVVEPNHHSVRLGNGERLDYDALVLAVGARRRDAFPRALTFAGDHSSVSFNGLLADLDEGWSRSVAFVVPPGTTWPLPLYELALMTAREVHSMGIDGVALEVVTPEPEPLSLFGRRAAAAVAGLLERAGIAFRGESWAQPGDDGRLLIRPGDEPLEAERVVALPMIEGPHVVGVPADRRGFIPIDDAGAVCDVPDVYAAGDGTTFPVKQGGLACQLADTIASTLAAAAGAPVEPEPFRPVLRGRLLTGEGAEYLERTLRGDTERPEPELRLWSAPRKVDGKYLSRWLEELEGRPLEEAAPAGGEEQVEVEVPLPGDATAAGDEMRLEPYSPPPAHG